MNQTQIHRGPDDFGCVTDDKNEVTLGMRRLSIVDITDGHQPMSDADNKVWIVFNGEIFNAPTLRKDLERDGCRFKTNHSDTEVLIHLYSKHGTEMLDKLNGMFSFVIHDRNKQVLFGARDHFGIKPLYYSFSNDSLAFASELKSLRPVPWINWDINQSALSHYLSFQTIPAPLTIYNNVKKLGAGECFTFDIKQKRLSTNKYRNLEIGNNKNLSNGNALASKIEKGVRTALTNAVERWTMSDVPIACSLSGGIDSSTIVGIMASELGHKTLSTYSLGFSDAHDLDERQRARAVARKWGTKHHEIVLEADDLLRDLDDMVYALDEPYGGGLPSWYVFKEMSKDVKVAMTGTGGDELFGNYGKWRTYTSWKQKMKIAARILLDSKNPATLIAQPIGSLYSIYFRAHHKKQLLVPSTHNVDFQDSELLVEALVSESVSKDPRNFVPYIDLNVQLPDEFLHMTDRFSMAHSLEARTPFLDMEFATYVLSLPPSIRIGKSHYKQLLIDSVKDLLPAEVLHAPKKGFVIPTMKWLQGELKPELLHFFEPDYLKKQGLFRTDLKKKLIEPFFNGSHNTALIWTLFMFQKWYQRYIIHP